MTPENLHILKQKATCASYEEPTEEEIRDQENDFATAFLNINKARKAIVKHIEESGINSGSIPCPICSKGQLRYSRAYNGHIHGRCTTPDCVNWME